MTKLSYDRLSFGIKQSDSSRLVASNAYNSSISYTFKQGKYKGKPIAAVPTSYLVWFRKVASLPLAAKCSEELERRDRIRHNTVHNALLRAAQVD